MPAFDSSLSITFLSENNHFFIGQILFFFALLSLTISIFALGHFVGQLLAKIPIYGDFCSEIYWSGSRTGFFLDPVCGPGKIFKKLKIKPIIDQSSISQYFSNPDQFLAGPKRLNSAYGHIRSGFSEHLENLDRSKIVIFNFHYFLNPGQNLARFGLSAESNSGQYTGPRIIRHQKSRHRNARSGPNKISGQKFGPQT